MDWKGGQRQGDKLGAVALMLARRVRVRTRVVVGIDMWRNPRLCWFVGIERGRERALSKMNWVIHSPLDLIHLETMRILIILKINSDIFHLCSNFFYCPWCDLGLGSYSKLLYSAKWGDYNSSSLIGFTSVWRGNIGTDAGKFLEASSISSCLYLILN